MHIGSFTVTDYQVSIDQSGTTITGNFNASAGSFEVKYSGDRGNADTYHIKLWGGQFDMSGKPTEITIIGCWEFGEFAKLIELIEKIV